jgi:hypothetical protein
MDFRPGEILCETSAHAGIVSGAGSNAKRPVATSALGPLHGGWLCSRSLAQKSANEERLFCRNYAEPNETRERRASEGGKGDRAAAEARMKAGTSAKVSQSVEPKTRDG